MNETLGKRISANRKRLGLTQDQLAERLGVTAQAVSKWENDLSCPDIQTLPRLAEIFDISTDELLGTGRSTERKPAFQGEICNNGEPQEGNQSDLEVSFSGGKKFTLGMAVWLLLSGGILMAAHYRSWDGLGVWDVIWPAGLLVFGLFGLYPGFSVFRLGCALAGGYFLASALLPLPSFGWAALLLVLGGLLLIEALRGHKKGTIRVPVAGAVNAKSSFDMQGDRFSCTTSFGEKHHVLESPVLRGGSGSVSFGEMSLDLTRCGEIAEGCTLDLNVSFGQLDVILPRTCRVRSSVKTSFAEFSVKGEPDPDAAVTVCISGSASFGEMSVRYQ